MTTRILAGLLMLAATACGGSTGYGTTAPPPPPPPPTPQPAGTVDANTNLTFNPRQATIAVGGTVTFVFKSIGHNVIFDTQNAGTPADIPGVNANLNVQRTFNQAGTYQYHCNIHPGMSGSVVVQ
ncbi:MAG TPA: plastocyanin/azurin family copper-binding protein [Gemmatimonadaceae bacterium]|nr:plastocyanin/azurin family copper-binding protein [Gemmatimonadaceae bacterium]